MCHQNIIFINFILHFSNTYYKMDIKKFPLSYPLLCDRKRPVNLWSSANPFGQINNSASCYLMAVLFLYRNNFDTVYSKSLDPLCTVTYYIKRVETAWTYSITLRLWKEGICKIQWIDTQSGEPCPRAPLVKIWKYNE